MIIQICIFIFSASAVWFVSRKEPWRRWGFVLGLCGQPFWFYSAITKQQWAIVALCVWYTYSWGMGVWNHFDFNFKSKPNRKNIIAIILALLFILALNDIAKGQDSSYVYLVRDSAQLITTNKIIVSGEYVNVLLEPIPGKVTRWTITKIEEAPDSVVTVLDNTNLTYSGTWVPAVNNALPFLNKTFHYSYTINSYLELRFTGRRVEWWGERNLSHGRAEVSIDGVIDKIVTPSSEGADIVRGKPSYFKTWPVSGEHVIKVRVMEGKSVLVDFVRTVR